MDVDKFESVPPNAGYSLFRNHALLFKYRQPHLVSNRGRIIKRNFEMAKNNNNVKCDRMAHWLKEQESLHSQGYNFNEIIVENVKIVNDDPLIDKKKSNLLDLCLPNADPDKSWEMKKIYNRIQWVYPEIIQKPSVRRNYAKRGVIPVSNNFSTKEGKLIKPRKANFSSGKDKVIKHKLKTLPSQSHKNTSRSTNDKTIRSSQERRVPYRPVLIVKNNKIITKYRPTIDNTRDSAISESEKISFMKSQLPKRNDYKGTSLFESSIKDSFKKEKPKGKKSNIFSVFNALFSLNKKRENNDLKFNLNSQSFKKNYQHLKSPVMGTDIMSTLYEKQFQKRQDMKNSYENKPRYKRPLETPLKIKSDKALIGYDEITSDKIAGVQVHNVKGRKNIQKSIADKQMIKQIKLKEETLKFKNISDNGIYTSQRGKKSAFKEKNKISHNTTNKDNRKLSWDSSVMEHKDKKDQNLQTDFPQLIPQYSQDSNELPMHIGHDVIHHLQRKKSSAKMNTLNNMNTIFVLNESDGHAASNNNRVIDIGEMVVGGPEKDVLIDGRSRLEVIDYDEIPDSNYPSQSIVNISSNDARNEKKTDRSHKRRHAPPTEEEDKECNNESYNWNSENKNDFNMERSDSFIDYSNEEIGTKIISDTLSELLNRAVKKYNKHSPNNNNGTVLHSDNNRLQNKTKPYKKCKTKKVIKLEAEKVNDKILIKRKVGKYREGKKETTDLLYYMHLDEEQKGIIKHNTSTISDIDPMEKEQEEKLLYLLKRWATGNMNLIFTKKEDVNKANLERIAKSDTLVIVNSDIGNMIKVKSIIMDSNAENNIDYNIKDPKWINIVNDIIKYRRGHLPDVKTLQYKH